MQIHQLYMYGNNQLILTIYCKIIFANFSMKIPAVMYFPEGKVHH